MDQEKPKFVSLEEWQILKEKLSNQITDQLNYAIRTVSSFETVETFLSLKKPKHFPEKKWNKIITKANKYYIISKELNNDNYYNFDSILKELEFGKPAGLLLNYWNEYKQFLLNRYYSIIYRQLFLQYDPIKYLKAIDISILDEERQNLIENSAYRIELLKWDDISSIESAKYFMEKTQPDWMRDSDFKKLMKKSESYISIENLIEKYKNLSDAFGCVLNTSTLKDKPTTIDENDWEKILKIENEISTESKKIKKDRILIESEKKELETLKEQILKQLSIIDAIMLDPDAISKIESYDNPFSKGNFENLQKISEYLILQKKMETL